jgi:hypothetical protein
MYTGPNIVTNGLVLSVDAANTKSYISGSTTWYDKSGYNNSGSLVSSPTFSSASGGSLVFNGTSQYADCGNNSSIQITAGTISAWINASSPGSSYRSIMAKQNAWGLFLVDGVLTAYDWGNAIGRSTGLNIANRTWNHTVMTFTETSGTPSNNAIIYINASPVLTTTIKHLNHSVNLQIAFANAVNQYISGSIAASHVYNRVLSQTEVLQNYNAQKPRFGIS